MHTQHGEMQWANKQQKIITEIQHTTPFKMHFDNAWN